MKAAIKLTTRATFSDMPRCTRSVEGPYESGRGEEGERHTGVRLNAGRDLTCTDGVEVGDVLTENGLEILLTNAFGAYFASVNPNDHVDKRANKGTGTFESMSK